MKICWIDLETTGLDENKHGIIQIGSIIEEDGVILDKFNIKLKPFKLDFLSKNALEINNTTIEQIKKYTNPLEAFDKFQKFLSNHVDKYDKYDKLILAGKNINAFDMKFLKRFFEKCNDDYFFSWFHKMGIELNTTTAEYMIFNGFISDAYNLKTLCEAFAVNLDEHDAMSDIEATRKLYYIMKGITVDG